MDREIGQVTNATCPTCGGALALAAQPDGSVAAATCPTCYPASAPAAAPAPETEKAAAPDREVGTAVTEEIQ